MTQPGNRAKVWQRHDPIEPATDSKLHLLNSPFQKNYHRISFKIINLNMVQYIKIRQSSNSPQGCPKKD